MGSAQNARTAVEVLTQSRGTARSARTATEALTQRSRAGLARTAVEALTQRPRVGLARTAVEVVTSSNWKEVEWGASINLTTLPPPTLPPSPYAHTDTFNTGAAVGIPAGTALGDHLLVTAAYRISTDGVAKLTAPDGSWLQLYDHDLPGHRMTGYWKIATATEVAAAGGTIAFSGPGGFGRITTTRITGGAAVAPTVSGPVSSTGPAPVLGASMTKSPIWRLFLIGTSGYNQGVLTQTFDGATRLFSVSSGSGSRINMIVDMIAGTNNPVQPTLAWANGLSNPGSAKSVIVAFST